MWTYIRSTGQKGKPILSANWVTDTTRKTTALQQLEEDIASIETELPPQVIAGIEDIHEQCPNVAP